MREYYLYSQDGHIFDAKDRRIGNVKDPIDGKNVVNKRFIEKMIQFWKVKFMMQVINDIKCI